MIIRFVAGVGALTLHLCNGLGRFVTFFIQFVGVLFSTRLKIRKMFSFMEQIGVDSLAIIVLTGASTGAVLALQSYIGFKRFGSEGFIGPVVALSMTRELGPVLTGLMVTGRAGSAIAAEIGTMRITEQIDALKTLCINTFQYLVVPRMLAGLIILPFLTAFSMICGIMGGYLVSVYVLYLNGEQYMTGITNYLEFSDIRGGLIKSAVFGLILSWVGCYKGFNTSGGSKGVGRSTTESVVVGSILILIANYFLASLLFTT